MLGEIQAIRDLSPRSTMVMSTNGVLLEGERLEAALLLDRVMISLDGDCQETAERYQVGIDFERVYRGMAALVEARRKRSASGPLVEWKYVVFRWNDRREQIERALRLAREAGVDRMTFWPAIIPLHGVSWRYRTTRFFQTLGTRTPYCRVVDLGDRPASAVSIEQ